MKRLGSLINSLRVMRNPLLGQRGYILGGKGLWIIPSLPGSRNAGAGIAAVKVITGVKIPDRVGVGSFESRQFSAAEIAEINSIRAETGIAEISGSPARPGSWLLLGVLPFSRAPAGFRVSVLLPDFFQFFGVRAPAGFRVSALLPDFFQFFGVRAPAGFRFSVPSAFAVFW
jgi:hypothetical protein